MHDRDALNAGALELGLSLSDQQIQQLLDYLALLQRWNQAFNLTAIRDPREMLNLHLLDSLAIQPYLDHADCSEAKRCLDVGSGAGLPGIPLAIINPHQHWQLLDSNGKKTRFLVQVKAALKLDNLQICQQRVERYQAPQRFDRILSRAFAALPDMLQGCHHLLAPGGCFLAMKGQWPTQELEGLGPYRLASAHALQVPGLAAERHLLIISPENSVSR